VVFSRHHFLKGVGQDGPWAVREWFGGPSVQDRLRPKGGEALETSFTSDLLAIWIRNTPCTNPWGNFDAPRTSGQLLRPGGLLTTPGRSRQKGFWLVYQLWLTCPIPLPTFPHPVSIESLRSPGGPCAVNRLAHSPLPTPAFNTHNNL